MTELENSLMDQLAQSEQRHQVAIAALHAQHKEEIAEMRAESDADMSSRWRNQSGKWMNQSGKWMNVWRA